VIPNGIRLVRYYIDSNIFIAYLSKEEGYYSFSENTFKKLDRGVISGAFSSIMFSEVISISEDPKSSEIIRRFVDHFGKNLVEVPADKNICLLAAEIRAKHNIKLPDAIHLASAIETKTDIFVTADKKLLGVAGKYMKTSSVSSE
jgi:predicted nucleic acid-binding protein